LVKPLCNSCQTLDCSNPILIKDISVFGSVQKFKVYYRGGDFLFVVGCDGYQTDNQESSDEDE
jgi:hypothetical protein